MSEKTNLEPEVLGKLVGRSGGVLHIGIVQNSKYVNKLATVFYKCSIKENNSLLFAIPLELSIQDRTIYNGANVFDIAIQGYFSGSMERVQRNFNYIFGMARLRTEEYAAKLPLVEARKFKEVSEQWLAWIETLPANDLANNESSYEPFDAKFTNALGTRILLSSGEIKSSEVKLNALDSSQWLTNYVNAK